MFKYFSPFLFFFCTGFIPIESEFILKLRQKRAEIRQEIDKVQLKEMSRPYFWYLWGQEEAYYYVINLLTDSKTQENLLTEPKTPDNSGS